MKAIYIGGGSGNKAKGGFKWKLYSFLFVFLVVSVTVLKLSAPTIVEKWINKNGNGKSGYAFSIRDVGLSLSQGEITLNDVKIFNPKSNTELLESPKVTLHMDFRNLLSSEEKKIVVTADTLALTISKDFTAELERIKTSGEKKKDFYLNVLEGKIGELNIIEKKDDLSRNVIELKDVNFKAQNFSAHAINGKTDFTVSSNLEGGKFNLKGKTLGSADHAWTIEGSLKQVPSGILNKIAGDKLPFSFNEPTLNAEISAHSENGKVTGEITPDIKRLNLIEEKPGIPTQIIARALTDELTFSLPFTLKDELVLQYADTFSRLKNYRKYAGTAAPQAKKSSFWPF